MAFGSLPCASSGRAHSVQEVVLVLGLQRLRAAVQGRGVHAGLRPLRHAAHDLPEVRVEGAPGGASWERLNCFIPAVRKARQGFVCGFGNGCNAFLQVSCKCSTHCKSTGIHEKYHFDLRISSHLVVSQPLLSCVDKRNYGVTWDKQRMTLPLA